jgi:hypothetical protein
MVWMTKCLSKQVIDISGQRFGKLTVIDFVCIENHKAMWRCVCDCGNKVIVSGNNLRTGTTKSCGCLRGKRQHPTLAKDNPRLHSIWTAMKRRCYNSNTHNYASYGGRGIKVCEEWQEFEPFYYWAVSTGYDSKAKYGECSIDRIDVNGDYSPQIADGFPLRNSLIIPAQIV